MVFCNLTLVIVIFAVMSSNEGDNHHRGPFSRIALRPQHNDERGSNCDREFHNYDFRIQNGCYIHPTHHRPHCQFTHFEIELQKVSSVRLGGESLTSHFILDNGKNDTVMGQPESFEVLTYQPQTFVFSTALNPSLDDDGPEATLMQSFPPTMHYINNILKNSMVLTSALLSCPSNQNTKLLEGLTLVVGRESYANFYHSMQLWWNAFYTINQPDNHDQHDATLHPKHLVFLDAHPETPLDKFWGDVFELNVTYLRRDYHYFNSLCLEQVRMIPSSPNAPFSIGGEAGPLFLNHCPAPEMMTRFTGHVLEKYQSSETRQIPGRIVLIDRQPYAAHPRSDTTKIDRQMQGLVKAVRDEIARLSRQETTVKLSLKVVALESLSMKEQIETIRQSQFLIGPHGAGLTHLLFLNKDAHVLEIGCYKMFYKRLVDWSSALRLSHHCLKSPFHSSKHSEESSRKGDTPQLSRYVKEEVIPIIHQVLWRS